MKKNFDTPEQVHFFDPDSKEWLYGIAYNSEIICACCGSVFPLDEVTDVTELAWIDFVDAIQDEDLPFGSEEKF